MQLHVFLIIIVGRVQWPRDGLSKVCYFSEAKCIISTFSQTLRAGGKCSVGKQKSACYRTLVTVYTSNGKMCVKTRQFCLLLGGRRGWEFLINLDSSFVLFSLAVKMLEFIFMTVLVVRCVSIIGKQMRCYVGWCWPVKDVKVSAGLMLVKVNAIYWLEDVLVCLPICYIIKWAAHWRFMFLTEIRTHSELFEG
jgi:hypothetical protein